MADPGTAALVIGAATALAGAGTAAVATQRQNAAAKRSIRSNQNAAAVQSAQVSRAAQLEKDKIALQARRIRGAIRARAAEAGFEDAGTYQALQAQAVQDAALNTEIIAINRRAQLDRIASGFEANFNDLSSRVSSPVLAAFSGGLEGAQAGLAIGGAVDAYNANQDAAKRQKGTA